MTEFDFQTEDDSSLSSENNHRTATVVLEIYKNLPKTPLTENHWFYQDWSREKTSPFGEKEDVGDRERILSKTSELFEEVFHQIPGAPFVGYLRVLAMLNVNVRKYMGAFVGLSSECNMKSEDVILYINKTILLGSERIANLPNHENDFDSLGNYQPKWILWKNLVVPEKEKLTPTEKSRRSYDKMRLFANSFLPRWNSLSITTLKNIDSDYEKDANEEYTLKDYLKMCREKITKHIRTRKTLDVFFKPVGEEQPSLTISEIMTILQNQNQSVHEHLEKVHWTSDYHGGESAPSMLSMLFPFQGGPDDNEVEENIDTDDEEDSADTDGLDISEDDDGVTDLSQIFSKTENPDFSKAKALSDWTSLKLTILAQESKNTRRVDDFSREIPEELPEITQLQDLWLRYTEKAFPKGIQKGSEQEKIEDLVAEEFEALPTKDDIVLYTRMIKSNKHLRMLHVKTVVDSLVMVCKNWAVHETAQYIQQISSLGHMRTDFIKAVLKEESIEDPEKISKAVVLVQAIEKFRERRLVDAVALLFSKVITKKWIMAYPPTIKMVEKFFFTYSVLSFQTMQYNNTVSHDLPESQNYLKVDEEDKIIPNQLNIWLTTPILIQKEITGGVYEPNFFKESFYTNEIEQMTEQIPHITESVRSLLQSFDLSNMYSVLKPVSNKFVSLMFMDENRAREILAEEQEDQEEDNTQIPERFFSIMNQETSFAHNTIGDSFYEELFIPSLSPQNSDYEKTKRDNWTALYLKMKEVELYHLQKWTDVLYEFTPLESSENSATKITPVITANVHYLEEILEIFRTDKTFDVNVGRDNLPLRMEVEVAVAVTVRSILTSRTHLVNWISGINISKWKDVKKDFSWIVDELDWENIMFSAWGRDVESWNAVVSVDEHPNLESISEIFLHPGLGSVLLNQDSRISFFIDEDFEETEEIAENSNFEKTFWIEIISEQIRKSYEDNYFEKSELWEQWYKMFVEDDLLTEAILSEGPIRSFSSDRILKKPATELEKTIRPSIFPYGGISSMKGCLWFYKWNYNLNKDFFQSENSFHYLKRKGSKRIRIPKPQVHVLPKLPHSLVNQISSTQLTKYMHLSKRDETNFLDKKSIFSKGRKPKPLSGAEYGLQLRTLLDQLFLWMRESNRFLETPELDSDNSRRFVPINRMRCAGDVDSSGRNTLFVRLLNPPDHMMDPVSNFSKTTARVSWFRDGEEISSKTVRAEDVVEQSYTIPLPYKPEDTGFYQCKITWRPTLSYLDVVDLKNDERDIKGDVHTDSILIAENAYSSFAGIEKSPETENLFSHFKTALVSTRNDLKTTDIHLDFLEKKDVTVKALLDLYQKLFKEMDDLDSSSSSKLEETHRKLVLVFQQISRAVTNLKKEQLKIKEEEKKLSEEYKTVTDVVNKAKLNTTKKIENQQQTILETVSKLTDIFSTITDIDKMTPKGHQANVNKLVLSIIFRDKVLFEKIEKLEISFQTSVRFSHELSF